MTDAPQERSELRQALSEALSASSDIPSLRAALRGKHIDLVIYTDREGQPRGTTLIDHRSKCAFKGSEVSRSLSGALLSLSSGPSLPGGTQSDDRDGRTSDGDRHTESTDDGRTNSGITEALSTLLAGMSAGGSGQKGKNLEDPMARKKKKKRQRIL